MERADETVDQPMAVGDGQLWCFEGRAQFVPFLVITSSCEKSLDDAGQDLARRFAGEGGGKQAGRLGATM